MCKWVSMCYVHADTPCTNAHPTVLTYISIARVRKRKGDFGQQGNSCVGMQRSSPGNTDLRLLQSIVWMMISYVLKCVFLCHNAHIITYSNFCWFIFDNFTAHRGAHAIYFEVSRMDQSHNFGLADGVIRNFFQNVSVNNWHTEIAVLTFG